MVYFLGREQRHNAQEDRRRVAGRWPQSSMLLTPFNRVYRTRQTVKRLRRELQEAEAQLDRWRVGVDR